VKANSGVRARVPAAGKVLEGDDKPTLLREDQHYLHYITIGGGTVTPKLKVRGVIDSHSFLVDAQI